MIRLRSLLALLPLCCLVVAPIYAGPVYFPDDSAVSAMTETDIQLLRRAAGVALEETDDGVMVHWENPETSAAGVLTPLSTAQQDTQVCRELELFGDARGRSLFYFCRQPDGSWRVLSSRTELD